MLMKELLVISAFIAIGIGIVLFTGDPASAEKLRRVELTCWDQDVHITHHFVLGEIDPTTSFLVEELRMAGSTPYVLLENPENKWETRELVWSSGWNCLLERHIKK